MQSDDINNFVWAEKYRPRTIDECILPARLKNTFNSFIDNKTFPNLLLTGPAGVGKTTVAKALLEHLGCDYIMINGSMNGNIDTLRTEIKGFASTVSFTNSRKYVILDEADYLNATSTQPALRNFMEEYSNNCGFILTCNYLNRIIEPLRSRCSVIDFKIDKNESAQIAGQFFKRCVKILELERIPFNKESVAGLITKYFPDWRRVINELQSYSINGSINSGILTEKSQDIKNIVLLIKQKDFSGLRTFVAQNIDNLSTIFEDIYEVMYNDIKPHCIPDLIVILAKYQYQSAFVASQEINIAACLAELMVNMEFK